MNVCGINNVLLVKIYLGRLDIPQYHHVPSIIIYLLLDGGKFQPFYFHQPTNGKRDIYENKNLQIKATPHQCQTALK